MNRQELQRIGLLLNCGGVGGTPGVCPGPQGPSQRRHEIELDSLAKTARDKGYSTQVQHSKTTHSSYLYVGYENESGGFTSVLKIRVSDHPKPGSKFGHDKKLNTVSIRTKDTDKLKHHLAALPQRSGKGKIYDDSSGLGVFKDAGSL